MSPLSLPRVSLAGHLTSLAGAKDFRLCPSIAVATYSHEVSINGVSVRAAIGVLLRRESFLVKQFLPRTPVAAKTLFLRQPRGSMSYSDVRK